MRLRDSASRFGILLLVLAMSDLAQRIRGGDIGAFEQLFRELHAPLCEVVDSYVRSQDVAEELVQDLFFVLWLKRETLEITSSLRGYLFASARNRALHHVRHRAIFRRLTREAPEETGEASMGRAPLRPDEALEAAEARRSLRRAIAKLPSRTRLAFVLRHDHQMRHAEIAEAMGISTKGVEKLLAVARRKLVEELGETAAPISLGAG